MNKTTLIVFIIIASILMVLVFKKSYENFQQCNKEKTDEEKIQESIDKIKSVKAILSEDTQIMINNELKKIQEIKDKKRISQTEEQGKGQKTSKGQVFKYNEPFITMESKRSDKTIFSETRYEDLATGKAFFSDYTSYKTLKNAL